MDIAVVLVALPLALPLALMIALAVFIDSPGHVVYRSRRAGRGGAEFKMLKFRTMIEEAGGPPLSAKDDKRYTPLGRTLAASRLDELPQLWNVLRGDMSIIGPRPEVAEFVAAFPQEYEEILRVRPGLTGPTQVAYAWEGRVLAAAQEHERARLYRDAILPLKVAIDLAWVRRGPALSDLLILVQTALLPMRHLTLLLAPPMSGGSDRQGRALPAATAVLLLLAVLTLTGLFVSQAQVRAY